MNVHFFVCPKKRTKENAACHLACLRQTSLRYSKKPGAAKLGTYGTSDSPRAFSDFFCVAWLREMAKKSTVTLSFN